MKNLVKSILDRRFEEANDILNEEMSSIARRKLHEMKKMVAARMSEDQDMDAKLDKANNVQEGDQPFRPSGTYQGGVRTHDEKGNPVSVSSDDQKKVDAAQTLRKMMGNSTSSSNSTQPSTPPPPASSTPPPPASSTPPPPDSSTPPAAPSGAKIPMQGMDSFSNTSRLKAFEEDYDESSGEESSMARSELASITKNVKSIMAKIKGNKELEAWTQSKITKAADYMTSVSDYMDGEKLDEARIGIVRARIRGGKIQRRKKVSLVPGMTMRGGTLTRMSPSERRRRKMGAKKGARKSKQKRSQMLRKRKLSLMKRQRLGI